MSELLSVPPSVAPVVSTSGISSLTVTVSLCAPGSMVKSTRISLPTSTTTFPRSNVLNPGNSTRTVYVPGISVGALYCPASSEVTVRARPLCVSNILMVAPGRTAPVESVTLPRIRPKLPCANNAKEKSNTTRVVLNTHVVILDVNVPNVIAPPFSTTPLSSRRHKTQNVSFNPSCITRLLPEPTSGLPAATSGVAHPQANVLEVPMSLVPPEAPPYPFDAPYGLVMMG